MQKQAIIQVEPNSIAAECGMEAGDWLVSINDTAIADVFAYRLAIASEYIDVLIEKPNGEEWLLEIDKEIGEDLGLSFAEGLMDEARSCRNKCVFCFIDQLPKGMRKTLYFKDDDSRLSFLQGNYVTLTNMTDEDITRIISYRLSPINVSVHAADPILRCALLQNKHAGKVIEQIRMFADSGIALNFQIVLCKGMNDGAALDETIEALAGFIPQGQSLSVVPVGISRYRETNGLPALDAFTEEECIAVIKQVHSWQDKLLMAHGIRFVFAADEFYLKAGLPMPPYQNYEDFPQIENGVGMIASMQAEVDEALAACGDIKVSRTVTVVTGFAAADFIRGLARQIMRKVPGLGVHVVAVRNDFFGHEITVSGLLTGHDIIEQLKGALPGEVVLLPCNLLRAGEEVLLDDVTLSDIEEALGVRVRAVDTTGKAFVDAVLHA